MGWRIINAADYGYQQRRRRIFIFAYKDSTKYANNVKNFTEYSDDNDKRKIAALDILISKGFLQRLLKLLLKN